MRLSSYWSWIWSFHCQSSCRCIDAMFAFMQYLCARWIASAKRGGRAKPVFSHLKNVLPHPSLNQQKWGTLIKGSYFKYQQRDTEHQQWYHFLSEKLKHKSAKPTLVRANIILPALMKRPAENESQKPLEQYKNSRQTQRPQTWIDEDTSHQGWYLTTDSWNAVTVLCSNDLSSRSSNRPQFCNILEK